MTTIVLVAGATGMLGNRIATHLLDQSGVNVRLLLRDAAPADPVKAQTVAALQVGVLPLPSAMSPTHPRWPPPPPGST